MKTVYQVIRRPLITEKTTAQMEVENQVAFEVDRRANKHEVREAVEALFGVKVQSVNTLVMPGKPKKFGRRMGRRPGYKKAVVTLFPGEELDFFALGGEANVEV